MTASGWIDQYIRPHTQREWARIFWNLAGTLLLALASLGVLLPILPTTPFLLLASACYLKGSPRMHRWMMTNRYFGKYISDYRAGQGIPLAAKGAAATMLWSGIGSSAVFIVDGPIIRIMLLLIGLGVTVHLMRIKTKMNRG